jgi:hypothetical protein
LGWAAGPRDFIKAPVAPAVLPPVICRDSGPPNRRASERSRDHSQKRAARVMGAARHWLLSLLKTKRFPHCLVERERSFSTEPNLPIEDLGSGRRNTSPALYSGPGSHWLGGPALHAMTYQAGEL